MQTSEGSRHEPHTPRLEPSAPPPGLPGPPLAFSRLIPLLVISLGLLVVGQFPEQEGQTADTPARTARAERATAGDAQPEELGKISMEEILRNAPGVRLLAGAVLLLHVASIVLTILALTLPSLRAGLWPRPPTEKRAWPGLLVLLEAFGLFVLLLSIAYRAYADGGSAPPLEGIAVQIAVEVAVIVYVLVRLKGPFSARAGVLGLAGGVGAGRATRAGAATWLAMLWSITAVTILALAVTARLGGKGASLLKEEGSRRALDQLWPHLNDPGSFAFVVLLVVVAAPVLEELLFRGLLYGTLRRAVGPVPAAAISALAFAAVHGLWIHAAVLFLLGYALARVYERTGSLWSAIALHATYNAAGLGLALLLRAMLS